ncbi:MAG TPA: TAT-variant-translocated molybdopterin oxidoreductase [Blastocatellia bacterium]|nr:TAT-variant-translocated molybdopterin oxidoreductase [Blastocatellia bacterium]
MTEKTDNLVSLRNGLQHQTGKRYWRSLEEFAETEEFLEFLHREFPQQASEWGDPKGRRRFLKLMGASIALAGLTGCTVQPTEKIVPYVKPVEEVIPGRPLYYATAMPFSGIASPILVESHMGRPTKVEGNPEHPASLGATDLFAQASILGLYDPDRSQTLLNVGDIKTWSSFLGALRPRVGALRAVGGSGLRLLTETITSPTLADQIQKLRTEFPSMKWHQYEPVGANNAGVGASLAFGEFVDTIYHFDRAQVVLSLDADFLASHPGNLRYIRQFIDKRRVSKDRQTMNRFYMVEPALTNTGAKADHRLSVRASEVETVARAIAAGLGVQTGGPAPLTPHGDWVNAVVGDLQKNRGASIVIAGDQQPPVVHALAHAINQALGNVGNTVAYIEPVAANPVNQIESIKELARDIEAGAVDTLIILGGNPVYNAPADLNFRDLLQRVPFTAHLSLYNDETSAWCKWHIPAAHYLESWGDVRAYDGTVTIIQPLIRPLYQNLRSAYEVLAALTPQPERTGYDIVREFWMQNIATFGRTAQPAQQPVQTAAATAGGAAQASQTPQSPLTGQQQPPATGPRQQPRPEATALAGGEQTGPGSPSPAAPATPANGFEKAWRKALHDGFIPNTAARPKSVTFRGAIPPPPPSGNQQGLELVFRPDPSIYDGRFANNGWLQELPKPVTKLTWDNAALLSPATAERLGLTSGDMITLNHQGRTLNAAVAVTPGHAPDSITLHLGYGRERAGRVGNNAGFNAYLLRTADAPAFAQGVTWSAVGSKYALASTQHHWSLEGLEERHIVREGTLQQYLENPDFAQEMGHDPPKDLTMYPNYEYSGYAWGMAIDMSACVGCNACVVACVSENNIPVVGKDQVARGREMHWLRVDHYYKGDANNPESAHFQPMPCQHCETAPCEVVCPVAATVHSAEGLNDMVYNRCIGTRYCSNNCPYKVRRFNFFLYQDFVTESLKLMRNPDVTVRSRGVMEKCTYCVQRINYARIDAEREGRKVRDGEIKTACQQTCPADAIVFGDINDPNSRVAKLKAEPRNYGVLAELNTRPRTTYLAEVRNPNPEIGNRGQVTGDRGHG